MKRAQKQHILEEHYLDFYSQAVAILDDEDDAKDAVQDAVVKTLVRIGVQNPVAYCRRATQNECFNILRRRRKIIKLDELMTLTSYNEDRIVQIVNESKEKLEPLERLLIEFHHEDNYTIPQLAGIIGVSPTTIKRLLAGANQKMKKTLRDNI